MNRVDLIIIRSNEAFFFTPISRTGNIIRLGESNYLQYSESFDAALNTEHAVQHHSNRKTDRIDHGSNSIDENMSHVDDTTAGAHTQAVKSKLDLPNKFER